MLNISMMQSHVANKHFILYNFENIMINIKYLSGSLYHTTAKVWRSPQGKIATGVAVGALSLFVAKKMFYPTTPPEPTPSPKSPPTNLLETRGHFKYDKYSEHHAGALQVVKKCFDKIANPQANNGWDWIYTSQKEDLFKANSFQVKDGSCFGNCCALAKAIIRQGRILTATELQAVERGDKFPKRAMGFQMVQPVSDDIDNRIDEAHRKKTNERPSNLTVEETQILGTRAALFPFNRYVQCLKTYGFTFAEVSALSNEKFKTLYKLVFHNISFEWAKKEFQRLNASAHELLEWATSNWPESIRLPVENKIERPGINPLTSYPQLIYPKSPPEGVKIENSFCLYDNKIKQSDLIKGCSKFSGFFIITGSRGSKGRLGHTLLLEIDIPSGTYVFYNNNDGFYIGKSLEECLELISSLLSVYSEKRFFPYIFEKTVR